MLSFFSRLFISSANFLSQQRGILINLLLLFTKSFNSRFSIIFLRSIKLVKFKSNEIISLFYIAYLFYIHFYFF